MILSISVSKKVTKKERRVNPPADYTDFKWGLHGFSWFLNDFRICAIGSESVESEISGLFQKSQKNT
jgi:hypothetical protein